jgi:hypothetical protein
MVSVSGVAFEEAAVNAAATVATFVPVQSGAFRQ